ncbi:LCP family protein [Nocardioides salsibiostraticola]
MSGSAARPSRHGARRAPKSQRQPTGARGRGGARRGAGDRRRRTRGLTGTLGMTFLGALVPGSGYLYAGRRALGAVVLVGWLGLIAATLWYFGRDVRAAIDFALDPVRLKLAALAISVGLVIWAFVVVTSYRLVRPRHRPRWHTLVGNTIVATLCLAVAAPMALAAKYAVVQADLVTTVFDDKVSATTPEKATEKDPWVGADQVNVLLLGGDGGEGRTGVRTDSVILLSLDTRTGEAVTFSLPRNMRYAQFPEDSPLQDLYPEGYDGYDDDAFYMLNAVYGQVPALHPGILGESDDEGADAVKQAVSGSLGIPVDYYMLVNLAGFREIVDAIGGVTVNINEPVAIEGNTDLGIPPVDYLDPGPDQELDGYEALWFSRGRYGSDDYARMERQRCMVDAIIEAADPVTLLTRYQALAKAGKEIVSTDIPRKLAPAFVDLALRVKAGGVKSVVFRNNDRFFSGDPDFDYVRAVVEKSLNPSKPKPRIQQRSPRFLEPDDSATPTDPYLTVTPEETDAEEIQAPDDAADVCAYNPTDETIAASQ